jgi:prevent-host-death family protein
VAVINIHEAKTHLSRLLSRVESGEEIVIAKAGKPVARLVPLINGLEKRKPGTAKGQIVLKKNFYKFLSGSLRENIKK